MSWLKKYGLEALKIFQIAMGIMPAVAPVIEQVAPQSAGTLDTLSKIGSLVQNIEASFAALVQDGQMASKNGAQKLAAILPLVDQELQAWVASALPGSQKVHDQATWDKGVQEVTQGVVDILNSLADNVVVTKPVGT